MATMLSLFVVFIPDKNGFRSISCINNESNHYSKTLMEIFVASGHMHGIYYKCKAQGKQKNDCRLSIKVFEATVKLLVFSLFKHA